MQNGNLGFGGTRWRSLLITTVAMVAALWSSVAMATITQGDFSVFGFFETREAGRWGEGGSNLNSTPTTLFHPTATSTFAIPGIAATKTGGSYDFNHWDLVEARQLADIRPDYHMVKNYKFLGRFDTLLIKDADFFAFYRPWYDAEGTLKNKGRAEPFTDATNYTHRELQAEYFKNDLREYYGQLNFTDNFSARIGKQQIIWSEADALSGTEVTNVVNARWHGVYGAESAEDTRTNLRMIKLNYILPDFLHTANNELEGFIIPGDFQGAGPIQAQTDPRNPYVVTAPEGSGQTAFAPFPFSINQEGQRMRVQEVPDFLNKPMIFIPLGPKTPGGVATGDFFDVSRNITTNISRFPSNSLSHSEFGMRYSSLLPIGNGLQTSFIYEYEYRNARIVNCNCPFSASGLPAGTVIPVSRGIFLDGGVFIHGRPRPGVPKAGTFVLLQQTDFRRNSFWGVTGTYYDKDLTDIVYRYDFFYTNHLPVTTTKINGGKAGPTGSEWTENARFIIAGDRPTYIPWISKQHTFLTAQYVNTWWPDLPVNAGPQGASGRIRGVTNWAFVAATNWLLNGQLTAGNTLFWDIDDNTGAFLTTNVYRYSRNVLFGVNAQWFLGRSGRYTDPLLFSREQRFNELEFTFTYEI
jgi:hypothetical protein